MYSVRANFIGYQAESILNIRVNASLTTTKDFALTPTAIQVEALEIAAETPIVQSNTTNTVRMMTFVDIENIPAKGYDPLFGDNWQAQTDARAWAVADLDTSEVNGLEVFTDH